MYKQRPPGPLRSDERGVHRAGEEARVAAQGATNHCHLHLTGGACPISKKAWYHVTCHMICRSLLARVAPQPRRLALSRQARRCPRPIMGLTRKRRGRESLSTRSPRWSRSRRGRGRPVSALMGEIGRWLYYTYMYHLRAEAVKCWKCAKSQNFFPWTKQVFFSPDQRCLVPRSVLQDPLPWTTTRKLQEFESTTYDQKKCMGNTAIYFFRKYTSIVTLYSMVWIGLDIRRWEFALRWWQLEASTIEPIDMLTYSSSSFSSSFFYSFPQ